MTAGTRLLNATPATATEPLPFCLSTRPGSETCSKMLTSFGSSRLAFGVWASATPPYSLEIDLTSSLISIARGDIDL
jgi:hypothetical protein